MMVKICGLTNRDDALAAMEGGASALGFNFYPKSPRYLAPEQAAELIGSLPAGVWKVGVFVNATAEHAAEIARLVGLDIVQLHGEESPSDYPAGLRVWKAFRVTAGAGQPWKQCPAEAVLLDGPAGALYGGAGQSFDWAAAALSTSANGVQKVILAGGLDDRNVGQAIAVMRPWGVDVCSRIESAPGRKDRIKMTRFLKAALAVLV